MKQPPTIYLFIYFLKLLCVCDFFLALDRTGCQLIRCRKCIGFDLQRLSKDIITPPRCYCWREPSSPACLPARLTDLKEIKMGDKKNIYIWWTTAREGRRASEAGSKYLTLNLGFPPVSLVCFEESVNTLGAADSARHSSQHKVRNARNHSDLVPRNKQAEALWKPAMFEGTQQQFFPL